MKRIIAVLLLSLATISIARAEGLDMASMTDDQLRSAIDQINLELAARQMAAAPSSDVLGSVDFDGVHLEVLSFTLSQETLGNNAGKPALVINCRFTNTSQEDKSFAQLVTVTAFQNRIECMNGTLIEGTNGALNTTKVQPGGSLEVPVGRLLFDTENTVDIQFGTFLKPDHLTLVYDPKL